MNKVLYTWDHIIDENGKTYQEWITEEEAVANNKIKSDMLETLSKLSAQHQKRMEELYDAQQ